MDTVNENSLKTCLEHILKETMENFSLKIVGYSDKSDGFISDVIFLSLKPNKKQLREYSIVFKYGKRCRALREISPIKEFFHNEIYMYNVVFPAFTQFQLEKRIDDLFDSVPVCYGTFNSDNTEIIVLENLKTIGYAVWDIRKPFTRKHIELILKEYAKLHAISVAMQHHNPKKFQQLCHGLNKAIILMSNAIDNATVIGTVVDDLCNLLKDELEEKHLHQWRKVKDLIPYIFHPLLKETSEFKVLNHYDSWNNNFMFKYNKTGEPVSLKILDWQLAAYSSPVADVSYLLFSSIAEDDIEDLTSILKFYYDNFASFSERLGFAVSTQYSFQQFLDDWKNYSKYGLLRSIFILKLSVTQGNNALDVAKAVEDGQDFFCAFSFEIEDKLALKERARHIVKYVTKSDII